MESEENGGTGPEFDAAFDAIYEYLRKQAARLRREHPNATLLTTEIVNQTYVRLKPARDLQWGEIPHFRSIVVKAMRRLMVDVARKRRAQKRWGKDLVQVPLDQVDVADPKAANYVLDLNCALDELAESNPRQAATLELKYFGGLSNVDIAAELQVSESTVFRELRVAEAWLRAQLQPPPPRS